MKRMILAVLLLVAAVAMADQIQTAAVQAPPDADVTLNLSLELPKTHKVSPEAPLKVEVTAEGAAIAQVPEPGALALLGTGVLLCVQRNRGRARRALR